MAWGMVERTCTARSLLEGVGFSRLNNGCGLAAFSGLLLAGSFWRGTGFRTGIKDVPSGQEGLVEDSACLLRPRAALFPWRGLLALAGLASKWVLTLVSVSGFPRLLQLFGWSLLA